MTTTERGTTLEEREAQLRRSILRVLDRGRKVVGTGFIVADDLIVTCAHVAREAIKEKKDHAPRIEGGERIEFLPREDWPGDQEPIVATVERELFRDEDAEDVAFLRLDRENGERLRTFLGDVRPLGLATSQRLEGADLRGFAYPKVRSSGALMTATVAGPLVGSREGRRLQLSSTNISPGCSGGPLWDAQGRVVGMAASIIVPDKTGRHGDTAFVIAAEVLAGVCRELTIEHVTRAAESVERSAKPSRLDNLGERPPIFEGRDDELERIRQALTSVGSAAVFSAVVGLGGVGKSRLALEYAFRSADEYDVRWWVRAGASASVQEDLVRLGQRLGLFAEVVDVGRAADEVLDWLSKHERWLLVLDNAEGPDELREALGGRMTRLGAGHVLITSRAQAWRSLAKPIEITTLAPEAARAVLLERSGREDDGFADAVAQRLGFLPLALVQAGAYVEATGRPFGKYLQRLERVGLALFEDRKAATGDYYQQTVAATWSINLGELRVDCPAAADLLDWLAFLDPDGVPVRLLREHGDALPPQAPACLASEDDLDDAVAALRRYSMVDRVEQPEDALRVHRLVQAVTREKLGDERRRELATAVVAWVNGVFEYVPDVTRIIDVPEGIDEQLVAVSVVDACVATSGHTLTLALNGLANYSMRRGMLAAARLAGERSLRVADGLAKEDPHSAQAQRDLSLSLDNLGNVEVQAGNLAAARDLIQRCSDILEGLAKEDPHSAQAQRDLSLSLASLGEVEERTGNLVAARELFQRCTNTLEWLAKEHSHDAEVQRDLSISFGKLGEVEVQAGNLAAARELFQRSLRTREGLAKAAPHSALAQRDLSVALIHLGEVEGRAGDLTAARDLFQRALQVAEGLAKADPHNAQAQRDISAFLNFLGDVEVQAGNLAVARDHYQRSLQVADGLAKADGHSAQAQRDLSISLDNLAGVEVRARNLAVARDHYQRSRRIREELAMADGHNAQAQRDISISLGNLGEVEMQASDLAVARDLFQRSLDILEGLAKTDGHRAQAQRDLSVALEKLGGVEMQAGNLAAARDLFQRSLRIREGLAKADTHSAQAAFDLCTSHQYLAHVAKAQGDRDSQVHHLRAASSILDTMDARGQHRGYAALDRARRYIDGELGDA